MKRNLLRMGGCLIVLAGLPVLSLAQNSKRLTVPGINNFWFVDKTVSTGGSITSRENTVRQLLTHASGFGYEFFDEKLSCYVAAGGRAERAGG